MASSGQPFSIPRLRLITWQPIKQALSNPNAIYTEFMRSFTSLVGHFHGFDNGVFASTPFTAKHAEYSQICFGSNASKVLHIMWVNKSLCRFIVMLPFQDHILQWCPKHECHDLSSSPPAFNQQCKCRTCSSVYTWIGSCARIKRIIFTQGFNAKFFVIGGFYQIFTHLDFMTWAKSFA